MRDLGTFRGTNHPDAYEIIGAANNEAARFGPPLVILLSIIVIAIIFGFGVSVEPVNV